LRARTNVQSSRPALVKAIFATVTLISITGCAPPPPDEAQIRQRMDDMTTALAERNIRAVVEPLAEDFSGETWNLDRRSLRLLLLRESRAHDQLRARLFDVDIELLSSERAVANFQVVLTGGSGLVPSEGRWFQVESGWRQTDDDWQLISARWENVIGR